MINIKNIQLMVNELNNNNNNVKNLSFSVCQVLSALCAFLAQGLIIKLLAKSYIA